MVLAKRGRLHKRLDAPAPGEKIIYDMANQYLSKFVHPASMSSTQSKDSNLIALAVPGIVSMALVFIQTAFPVLITCLDSIAPAPPA